jgi:hypothetical protein
VTEETELFLDVERNLFLKEDLMEEKEEEEHIS